MRKAALGKSVAKAEDLDRTIDYSINIAFNGILREAP